MCRLSWNLGASTSWNTQGLSKPVMGLIYLSLLDYAVSIFRLFIAWFFPYVTLAHTLRLWGKMDGDHTKVRAADQKYWQAMCIVCAVSPYSRGIAKLFFPHFRLLILCLSLPAITLTRTYERKSKQKYTKLHSTAFGPFRELKHHFDVTFLHEIDFQSLNMLHLWENAVRQARKKTLLFHYGLSVHYTVVLISP